MAPGGTNEDTMPPTTLPKASTVRGRERQAKLHAAAQLYGYKSWSTMVTDIARGQAAVIPIRTYNAMQTTDTTSRPFITPEASRTMLRVETIKLGRQLAANEIGVSVYHDRLQAAQDAHQARVDEYERQVDCGRGAFEDDDDDEPETD